MYGIFSNNDKNIIVQKTGTKIKANETKVENIAFGSEKGEGIIYKDWTEESM